MLNNKRGVSVVVGYVLLIVITISISVLVYAWLRWYVTPADEVSCPDGVSLIIKDYSCSGKKLTITLQNKGLFSVAGYVIRVNDRIDAEVGFYNLDDGEGVPLGLGSEDSEVTIAYNFPNGVNRLTFVDIQPFIAKNGGNVYCEKVVSQTLENC